MGEEVERGRARAKSFTSVDRFDTLITSICRAGKGVWMSRYAQMFNVAVIAAGVVAAFAIRYLYGRDAVLAAYPYLVAAGFILLSIPLVPFLLRRLSTPRSTSGPRSSKEWHKSFVTALWIAVFAIALALQVAKPYLGNHPDAVVLSAWVLTLPLGVCLTLLCNRIFLGEWRPRRPNAPTQRGDVA